MSDYDEYNIERKNPTEAELRRYLLEVDYKCPLCGKILQSSKQKKFSHKKFQIAHIYPNSPTEKQQEELEGLERLGENSEDFKNKIALCKDCHSEYDFRTNKEEYNNLLNIKKECLNKIYIKEDINELPLEELIYKIIDKLSSCKEKDIVEIDYSVVDIDKKFLKDEFNIKRKIEGYIIDYFYFIQKLFNDIEENNKFNIISTEFKLCFLKINEREKNKSKIFKHMVDWVMINSKIECVEACEAIVSFFVQNCEVFEKNETTK